MTDGPDLFAATREHDLPVKWDGAPVEWGPWEARDNVFICPPMKPEPCGRCRSTSAPLAAIGVTLLDRGGAVVHIGPRRLHVLRCPDCFHDVVWDVSADEWWDLDPTDYGDHGSVAPDSSRWQR